tara:strand:+ start:687 stop:1058 length:372 start_codon:yes stop_codon:yes gene_type:complete
MSNVTVITPPDFLLNDVLSILLIEPSTILKQEMNTKLSELPQEVNLYYYNEENIDWLLKTVKIADIVIIDLDSCSPMTKNFSSYIISQSNTFYLTNDSISPYNLISKNRIYDLSWLNSILKEE